MHARRTHDAHERERESKARVVIPVSTQARSTRFIQRSRREISTTRAWLRVYVLKVQLLSRSSRSVIRRVAHQARRQRRFGSIPRSASPVHQVTALPPFASTLSHIVAGAPSLATGPQSPTSFLYGGGGPRAAAAVPVATLVSSSSAAAGGVRPGARRRARTATRSRSLGQTPPPPPRPRWDTSAVSSSSAAAAAAGPSSPPFSPPSPTAMSGVLATGTACAGNTNDASGSARTSASLWTTFDPGV